MNFLTSFIIFISSFFSSMNYESSFSFYFRLDDDFNRTGTMFFDKNFPQIASDATKAFILSFPIKNPTELGFAGAEDYEYINNLTEKFEKIFTEKFHILCVGFGQAPFESRDFYYYAPSSVDLSILEAEIRDFLKNEEFSLQIFEDKNHEMYQSILPDAYEAQLASNEQIIDAVAKHEKNENFYTDEREFIHFFYAENEEWMQKLAKILEKTEEKVETEAWQDEESEQIFYSVKVEYMGNFENIAVKTIQYVDIARENNAEYDGWECGVMRKAE